VAIVYSLSIYQRSFEQKKLSYQDKIHPLNVFDKISAPFTENMIVPVSHYKKEIATNVPVAT
jgi:hypothetical protein